MRERKEILKQRARLERSKHRAVLPAKARARARNASEIAERLGAVGVPTAAIEARGRKRERSLGPRGGDADADMDDDGASAAGSASRMDDGADESPPKRGRALKRDGDGAAGGDFDDPRSKSRSRSQSIAAARARAVASKMARAEGSATPELRAEAKKQMRIQQKKRNKLARAGDADRHTGPKLLKHRLAGKSGLGTKTNGR